MTSFYSWRQFLMTFHGRYRGAGQGRSCRIPTTHSHDEHDDHDDHHAPAAVRRVHESPLAMLVPLAVLARRRGVRRHAVRRLLHRRGFGGFWHGALGAIAGNGLKPHAEDFPLWVELAPLVLTIARLRGRLLLLHPAARAAGADGREAAGCSTPSSTTNGTSTSSTTSSSCGRRMRLGRFLWKVGDGTIIDGLGPDGVAARVLDVTRGAVRLQTGYVYHYAFVMLLGVVALATWFMFAGGAPMSHLPSSPSSPSCRWSARCSSCSRAAATRPSRATRAGSRWSPPSPTSSVAIVLWAKFDGSIAGLPVRRARAPGWAPASPTTWASTASRCCSSC